MRMSLDGIEEYLAAELGEQVRERRAAQKIHEDGSAMTQEELAQIFHKAGVPMTDAGVVALESGQWRDWDGKMFAALVFLLEISGQSLLRSPPEQHGGETERRAVTDGNGFGSAV